MPEAAFRGVARGRGSPAPAGPSLRACLFAGERLVLADGAAGLPDVETAATWAAGGRRTGAWFKVTGRGGAEVMAAGLPDDWEPPAGVVAIGLRAALWVLSEPEVSLALTAAHLVRWRRTSRFCGVCGAATEPSRRHRAMKCPSCGHLAFPKVSPAVIVQVTRGDRILLGRSRRHPRASYSVLAGFVDPGENLEDAVHREIAEEAGIRVRDVRYFGSQPWPFPDSLMVGFTAVWEGGDIASLDDELEDLGWFAADALPPVPPQFSIARALIDDFARRHGVDPATLPTWKRSGVRG